MYRDRWVGLGKTTKVVRNSRLGWGGPKAGVDRVALNSIEPALGENCTAKAEEHQDEHLL